MLLEHLTAGKLEFSGCLSGFINHNINHYMSRRCFYPSIILWSATSWSAHLLILLIDSTDMALQRLFVIWAYILTLLLGWMPKSLEQSPTVLVYWDDLVASGAHCHLPFLQRVSIACYA